MRYNYRLLREIHIGAARKNIGASVSIQCYCHPEKMQPWIYMNSLGTTWANGLKFVMNHAPGAGSITPPVHQQSSALSLCYGCSLQPLISIYDVIL